MVGKTSRRAPVGDVKPLTEERKDLIERYTVDDAQAERLARRRRGEPEAPAAEAKPLVQEAKTGAAAESYTTRAMTAETISDRRAAVEASRFGAEAGEAPTGVDEQVGPAAAADEKRGSSRPQRARRARRQGAEAGEAPTGVDEQVGPAAEADEKRGSSRPQRARRARRQGSEADEVPAGVDEQAGPAAEADEKRGSSRPQRARRARRQGAEAGEAPTGVDEQVGPAAEADEKRGSSRPQRARRARRQGAEADEVPAGVDEQAGPAAEADEKRGSSRPQRARRARRQGAEANEVPAGVDEQAGPAVEADEKRLADEQARLAAEGEVRRLTEELTRLAAEAEAMRAGPQPPPQLDAAAEAVRTVEAQRTLKAVAAPIDVPPVEQTEVCFVTRWRGYLTCEFFARRPDGAIVATSGTFRWRKSDPPPEDGPAREAFDRLVAELLAYGWEERGQGALWYEQRFERPAHSTPSEREAAAGTRSRH